MPLSNLPAAVVLDLLLGDPYRLPHPVRWIGRLIALLEQVLYPKRRSRKKELAAGGFCAATVVFVTGCVTLGVIYGGKMISPPVFFIFGTVLSYYCISAKSLVKAAGKVYQQLKNGDPAGARHEVGMIVGRDTGTLNEHEIARATVETVSESIVDGIVSPLFYLTIGGPVTAMVFKAVSTMDSMIGHRNERYRYFGTVAARLDDLMNFIPARLTAFLFIPVVALLTGRDPLRTVRTVLRDRLNHPSPNSAHGESAVAGMLGVCLGGPATYQGVVSEKPLLYSEGRPPEAADIRTASTAAILTAVVATVIFTGMIFVVKELLR